MSNLRSITPLPDANFTPELGNYKTLQPFRYWCQKVLPLVYDDSLSYYELLCKVVDYLNKTMEDVETLHGDVTNLHTAYEELQAYVNNYFSTLDVQEEINNKLDNMANSGVLYEIIRRYTDPIVNEQNEKINVLNSRMSTFTSLPDGSTVGDAELVDIRVGYNGHVYPSAGDAVRHAFEKLNTNNLNPYHFEDKTYPNLNWNKGYIGVDGNIIVENMYHYSDIIAVPAFHRLKFCATGSANMAVIARYNSEGTFEELICNGKSTARMLMYAFSSDEDSYVRVCTKDAGYNSTYPAVYSLIKEKSYQSLSGIEDSDKFGYGYISSSTNAVEPETAYRYSNLIHLNKGESLRYKASGSSGVWLLSEWDTSYNFISGIMQGDRKYHDDIFTADKNMFVRLCSRVQEAGFPVPEEKDFKAFEQFYEYSYYSDVKNSKLYGKTITFIGDSTAYGNLLGNSVVWLNRLANDYNMTAYNMGINGNSVARYTGQTDTPMCERYVDIPESDFIVLIGGSNDKNKSVPLGDVSSNDTTTFCGALNVTIDGLRALYPKAHLLFFTLYSRQSYANSIGLYERAYADAMISVCKHKSVPCYDNFAMCGLNLTDANLVTWADEGVSIGRAPTHHLSLEGYNWLYPKYVKMLENML